MKMHEVRVTNSPDSPFLELGIFKQSLNSEFRFQADSSEVMVLQDVTVDGFDKQDRLLFRLPLNNFGIAPSILVVPERKIEFGRMLGIFNPLPDFPLGYPIHRLCYQFMFRSKKGKEANCEILIYPSIYEQKAALILPFAGTCLVTEGHDLLTHHRRNFPFTHPLIRQIGITGNSSRFTYDFVLLDNELRISKDNPRRNEDFFCWGKHILCPGDGIVVGVVNDLPDNPFHVPPSFDVGAHIRNPETEMMKHFGNYVEVDHGNHEFSLLGHMQKGSVQVKTGNKVAKGELVGRIGTSSDSFSPHIHYQLQNGKGLLKSRVCQASLSILIWLSVKQPRGYRACARTQG